MRHLAPNLLVLASRYRRDAGRSRAHRARSTACAICTRIGCPQRAAAPAGRTLAIIETDKTISPYPVVAS